MKKATDQEILTSYSKNKNIWKVAEIYDMSGQSVWERLKRLGIDTTLNLLSDKEKKLITSLYESGFKSGDGQLKKLSKQISRTIPFISRYAKTQGLTNYKRSKDKSLCLKTSENNKKWHENNEHPRGMKGKTHSQKNKDIVSKTTKKWHDNATDEQKFQRKKKQVETSREKGNYDKLRKQWKSGWRTIGGQRKYFRSRWEANYARYLEMLKEQGQIQSWEHEPQTFWFEGIKRGCVSYLPDFKVFRNDGTHYWVEVKGWMDSKSKTKLKRFAKYYPEETLFLVDSSWFKKNFPILSKIIKDWEFGKRF